MDPQAAISAAISGNWKDAIRINTYLLKQNPRDIDSLNRLGRAYLETGLKTKSRLVYEKVLRLDKFNTIAAKNIDLIKSSRLTRGDGLHTSPPPAFLEEPGITKTVSLIRLGDPKTVSAMHPGAEVTIACHGHAVNVMSSGNAYLGRLPDDLSSRMRSFLASGNKYAAWIRSVDHNSLKIFVKELTRSAKYKNTPSFPVTEKLTYSAFTPPELVHQEKPVVQATEEDSESFADTDQPEESPEEEN